MEHYLKMNKRGQSSIEFILLVSVAMIYISTIILPSVEVSKRATDDVMQLSQSRLAAEKLANNIDAVNAASGDAKTTITAFVPSRGQVKCLACDYSVDPITCGSIAPFNTIGFDFWLTENDQTPLLENPACPKETNSPFKSICSKTFRTMGSFYCIGAAGAAKPTIGDQTAGVSIASEISIEKKDSGTEDEKIYVTIR